MSKPTEEKLVVSSHTKKSERENLKICNIAQNKKIKNIFVLTLGKDLELYSNLDSYLYSNLVSYLYSNMVSYSYSNMDYLCTLTAGMRPALFCNWI